MHTVTLGNQAKPVAATWDELSREQVAALLPLLYGFYPNPIRQRLEVLRVLLGISPALLLCLTAVQLIEIEWLADFVLDEPVALTRQLLPQVRPAWYRPAYYGPADELANVSFLEFAFADAYFVAYANTRETRWLDSLVATLYRPQRRRYRPHAADYGGDRRADFNENLLEAHTARLARLPEATKLLVFTFYQGCRRALEQRYPLVFTPAGEAQARSHPDGWAFVLREMSGGAFGSFAETGRQAAGQLLAKMQDDQQRAEELQRQQHAQNPT